MSAKGKGISSYKWIIYTALFMTVVIGVLGLTLWKPLVGGITIILLMLTLFVGSFIKAYISHQNNGQLDGDKTNLVESKLDHGTLERSQRLLRYATAILAFLSLMTTAEGMQSFVFDKSWLAYLGSFAVQSILVVFSLLLCRFYVRVSRLAWNRFTKKIINSLLILFFCVALIVSSTFSFSYIANNAYYGNWLVDSEMIIQTHLMEAAYDLQRENDYRGSIILNDISKTASNKLSTAIDDINDHKKDDIGTELQEYLEELSFPECTDTSVIIPWDLMYQSYPRYSKDIDILANTYSTTYLPQYQYHVNIYNKITSDIENWESNISSDKVTSYIRIASDSISLLDSLHNDIIGWRSHLLNNDISAYRKAYQTACFTLGTQFNSLKTDLEYILTLTAELESISENNINTDINSILSQIYLLGVDDTISVTAISEKITDLALEASKTEDFSSEDIAQIMGLRDMLVSYNDYKELQTEITEFINSNLQHNYQVVRDTDEDKEDPTDTTLPPANDSTEHVDVIGEREWRKTRSNDFNEFYKLVKSLPIVDDNQTSYDETEVILDASQIHRDLLGEATEFEKAFNFFKYRFPFMAFFSAFIAVFFDLGSFLTGCFLYVTEFFETKQEDEQPTEENNTDQEGGTPHNQPNE